ncbi:hypothetical protein HBI82_194240 [Parastagonospora nodorum]|nr:hypothetical protein HBI09_209090 [Parastagonospora nodorum]KAH4996393.1 hypothetical protein HBI77_204310 [Parastagonospora nodorum]KAH5990534.1 hypothetical protein HBI82_194240 [Parastagonospora nodorum]KAH6004502.1 hypothetical protein HBI83_195520 [Parastagonospora nodorum]
MPAENGQIVTRSTSASDKSLFNRDDVLQCDNETLYDRTVVFATQLAILGYTDTALRLVGKLNVYDWYHPYRARLRPLYVLWDMLGQWPEGELKRVRRDIGEGRARAAKEKIGEETGKRRRLEVDDSPITDADVEKYVDEQYRSYASCWWYPELPYLCGEKVPPSPHDVNVERSAEEVRNSMRKLIGAVRGEEGYQREEGNDANRVNPSTALVSALELRIKLREMGEQDDDDDDDMPSEEDILSMIAKDLNGHGQIEALMQSRRAWQLLKNGALLRLLRLNKSKIDCFASQLEAAVTERMDKGKQPPPTRPIKEILEAISTNTRTHPDSIELHEEMDQPIPSTILHPPASESSISATEKRLNTSLPADYKSYLLLSNGNDAAFGGIINEAPLWKCEDIRWLRDDEDYFSDLHIDIPADMSTIAYQVSGDTTDWPTMGRSIVIGQEDVDTTFLITPDTVARVKQKVREILDSKVSEEVKISVRRAVQDFAGGMDVWEGLEWCVVAMKDETMRTYCSFEGYLRAVEEGGRELGKDCWNVESGEFFGYVLVE